MSDQEKPRTAENLWKPVKDFVNKASTMAVRVTACELAPKFEGAIPLTHYTWELVRLYDGRVLRYFPIMATVEHGVVQLEDFHWDEFIELQKEAMVWVKDQRQDREDRLKAKQQLSKDYNQLRGLRTITREDVARKKGLL